MRAIAEAMEKLAIDDRGSPGELWAGPGGESAASLIAGVLREAEPLPPCDAATFAGLIERLVADETVRSGGASHPRLRILGAMEARLVRADRLILAGLEEGVWPQTPRLDPFLSRSMRAALGLPPPERRIGLAAHDFAQAACAPDVLLITCARRDGQPAVRSRWLWRLETLAAGAGAKIDGGETLRSWRLRLDQRIWPAPQELAQASRPAPTPPLAVRPRALPVTAVETWVRDPYAVYARRILDLRPLDRPAKPFDNRGRGTAIHKAAEVFALGWPHAARDPADVFASAYLQQVTEAGATVTDLVRERALAGRTGAYMAGFERARRMTPVTVVVEQEGEMVRPGPQGPFRVTAKPDRLEVAGDRVHVLDFKTGAPPSEKEVAAGFAPQLTLTAAIVQSGGFTAIGQVKVGELTYVRLTGRGDGGETRSVGKGRESELTEQAVKGLDAWIARFDDPKQAYVSRIAVKFMSSPSDYDHLARVQEWSSGGDDGGDE
jgi:ATP-dependent helicase/nuclease subunit B